MFCEACDSRVATYRSSEATPLTVIACSITCLLFWLWSLFLLPFIIPLTKSVDTRCVKCDASLHKLPPFGLEILKDEIISL